MKLSTSQLQLLLNIKGVLDQREPGAFQHVLFREEDTAVSLLKAGLFETSSRDTLPLAYRVRAVGVRLTPLGQELCEGCTKADWREQNLVQDRAKGLAP